MGEIFNYRCPECNRNICFSTGIIMNYHLECSSMLEHIVNGRYGKELRELALKSKFPAVKYRDGLFKCDECEKIEKGRYFSLYDRDPEDLMREWNFKLRVVPFVLSPQEKDVLLFEAEKHCDECGKKMRFLEDEEIRESVLKCPQCKFELVKMKHGFFD